MYLLLKNRVASIRLNLLSLLCALVVFAPAPLSAAELQLGSDYVLIDPIQPTDNPAKIEVIEFFSYGCPHCSEFHPALRQWVAQLPADIAFKRVPVSFGRAQWASLSKLFYALEASGDLLRLDSAVFAGLHAQGLRLYDDKSILEWLATQGGDSKKLADAYRSFGVSSKVKRADQMAQSFKIEGVPTLVIDGKYRVVGKKIESYNDLLVLSEQLINKVRAERAALGKAKK
ncbi:MAG: thiol:disulfide interchange protein DsbA/DsbL [Pseudomonadota bacterium]